MGPATARSAEDRAGSSPSTRFPSSPERAPAPYLQAVGAWLRRRRRRLVRLEEDLLAPPEELDNSDEDVVQHQDHARSRPPARRPGRCARSARPRQLRRVRASVRARPRPRTAHFPPLDRQAPPRTAHVPAPRPPRPRPSPRIRGRHLSACPIFGPPSEPPTSCHFHYLSAFKILPAGPLLGSPAR